MFKSKLSSIWQIIGLLTLLAALLLASRVPLSMIFSDLMFIGAIGLFACARWHIKGLFFSLGLLVLCGLGVHGIFEVAHLVRLGLEASLVCSFLTIALTSESEADHFSNLESQLTLRGSAIQNLEEEIFKAREAIVQTQMASAHKTEELQKNLDDLALEKSSLEILNDVLRKNNAAYFEDKNEFFKVEMELQKIVREQEEPLLAELVVDLDGWVLEIEQLQEENKQLQSLITHFLFDKSLPPLPFAAHRTPLPVGPSSSAEMVREALLPKKKKLKR